MKTTKPVICWCAHMHLPKSSHDYGKLTIDIMPLKRPAGEDYLADSPIPIFVEPYNLKERLTITYMSSYGSEPESGYLDGQHWFGERMELHNDRITGTSPVLAWIKRNSPDDRLYGLEQVLHLLFRKAQQVAYSGVFSNYVAAKDWAEAEAYCRYADQGASSSGGHILSLFLKHGFSDSQITSRMAEALRRSRYCGDASFASWFADGCRWKALNTEAAPHHRPLTRVQMLGNPKPAEPLIADPAQPHPVAA